MFKSINGGILPQRATKYSAGFDVFANEDVVIGAGETKLIGLGIALDMVWKERGSWACEMFLPPYRTITQGKRNFSEFMENHYLALHIRSSLRANGLTSLGTGIIDMDYRDEIKMVIHNPFNHFMVEFSPATHSGTRFDVDAREFIRKNAPYEIKKGDKIAQLILCRHEGWLLPAEYTKDEERLGGFGSTGA